MKKTFDETINTLRELGLIYDDQSPRLPEVMPKFDDPDPCGFSIFRMGIEDLDLSALDMRRTFFSRSEIVGCNFTDTDLAESNMCWNDFISVNFTRANLAGADLRASIYENTNFTECNLSGSDLRLAEFNNCIFTLANMQGAKLTKTAGEALPLSIQQKKQIDWQDTEGEEPSGG